MSRLIILGIATLAFLLGAGSASAASLESGPAGLRLAKMPTAVQCPPGQLVLRVRFTRASARRGVRAARVDVRGKDLRRTIRARRGKLRRATLQMPCGVTSTVRITAVGRRGKALGRKSFSVSTQSQSGTPVPEPGPPPSAEARLPGVATTWTAMVDHRRGGTREGQTCVQVSATTPERGIGFGAFCGLLTEDPFFAKTQAADDPAGGKRLVLAGAANLDTVASVSVISPGGSQQLGLSAPEETAPGNPSAGGFIAVFDDATTDIDQLTLTVTLKNGTTQSHANPRSVNLRGANGQRL
jgi:hypothetical protein